MNRGTNLWYLVENGCGYKEKSNFLANGIAFSKLVTTQIFSIALIIL